MEILKYIVLLYLAIGVYRALRQIRMGRYGTKGKLPTFFVVTLTWPLFLDDLD
jgi:hypothetical protein